ncbi:penicillin-binding domain protein [Burkholderia thailandensis]|uniref:Penicillin-binding domain protein n=1 Tax=Burkholderia thailandensis TaxID=57975 RepID=A0AAW9CLG7_BURTH|nr:penicillin-binding domain protein [Burkholderia thailandensis]MDW9251753.1 penicillin-binding domain protein [Burkholderia thailandensis]
MAAEWFGGLRHGRLGGEKTRRPNGGMANGWGRRPIVTRGGAIGSRS